MQDYAKIETYKMQKILIIEEDAFTSYKKQGGTRSP